MVKYKMVRPVELPGIYIMIEGLRYEPFVPVRLEAFFETQRGVMPLCWIEWDGTDPREYYYREVRPRLAEGTCVVQYGGTMEYWLMNRQANAEDLYTAIPFDISVIWSPRDDLFLRYAKVNRIESGIRRGMLLKEILATYPRAAPVLRTELGVGNRATPRDLSRIGQKIRFLCMRYGREYYDRNKHAACVLFMLHGYDDGEMIWNTTQIWKAVIRARIPRWTNWSDNSQR